MTMIRTAIVIVSVVSWLKSNTEAFAPACARHARAAFSLTQLDAMDRRDALNFAFASLLSGTTFLASQPADAAQNPALETFKGRAKANSYYPGKGMRLHEELIAAKNPALETFKGRAKANSYYPGKGMRLHEELIAAKNPALETFKGRAKANSYYPGKGMRESLSFDELMSA